jgi:hypothetical protein
MSVTRAEAQAVTLAFTRNYPGALELAYRFREDVAEMYEPRIAEILQDMKGGYVPKETIHDGRTYRGHVDVPLQKADSAGDLPSACTPTIQTAGREQKFVAPVRAFT